MKPRLIVTASVLATFAAVFLLVALQSMQHRTLGGEHARPVTAAQQPRELTQDNLVDALASMQLAAPIAKVEWDKSILKLDLKVTGTDIGYQKIYGSMADVAELSFGGFSNVEQVLLRVLAEDEWTRQRHLLLAADIRRNQWPDSAIGELRGWSSPKLSDNLKEWFHIMETALWKKQFERANQG